MTGRASVVFAVPGQEMSLSCSIPSLDSGGEAPDTHSAHMCGIAGFSSRPCESLSLPGTRTH